MVFRLEPFVQITRRLAAGRFAASDKYPFAKWFAFGAFAVAFPINGLAGVGGMITKKKLDRKKSQVHTKQEHFKKSIRVIFTLFYVYFSSAHGMRRYKLNR